MLLHLFLSNIFQKPWSWMTLKAVNFNIKCYQINADGWRKWSMLYTSTLPLQAKANLREPEKLLSGQLSYACQTIKRWSSFVKDNDTFMSSLDSFFSCYALIPISAWVQPFWCNKAILLNWFLWNPQATLVDLDADLQFSKGLKCVMLLTKHQKVFFYIDRLNVEEKS